MSRKDYLITQAVELLKNNLLSKGTAAYQPAQKDVLDRLIFNSNIICGDPCLGPDNFKVKYKRIGPSIYSVWLEP